MNRPKEVLENCQVEWDKDRGVLYVHNNETGITVLRICGISTNRTLGSLEHGMIDIIKPERISLPCD